MEPWFGPEEKNELLKYLDQNGWMTEHAKTAEFETEIASFTRSKYCLAANNGTVTLTMAAIACGIGAGDEVVVPNYTMIATPNSIKLIGAMPTFVDVEYETLCMDINRARDAINEKTKAIMLVSANGRYPKAGINAFEELCQEKRIWLIEDAAQSLGSFYPDGRHIGSVGIIGSFSFSTPKIITTGQGGALITNDEETYLQLKKIKDFGRSRGGTDIHDSIGYNFKYTDLQACIGLAQLKKLSWRIMRKKEILRLYRELLDSCEQVEFFAQDLENTTPWFIDIRAERRDELAACLSENQIGTRLMYPPINRQKAYSVPGDFPVSNDVGARGLWLPSSSKLTDEQIRYICAKIISFYDLRP